MKRVLFVSAIGAVGALVLLQLSQPDAASAPARLNAVAGDAEAHPLPAVQVEQVLVHADLVKTIEPDARPVAVPVNADRPMGTNTWTAATPTRSAAVQPVLLQDDSTTPAMLARAKRAFLGDGRHRPEPFPRVKDN